MTDTTQAAAAPAKAKKVAVALRDWLNSAGQPVDAGSEHEAVGFRYIHLPTAKRLDPAFDPETSTPHAEAEFIMPTMDEPTRTMCAIFGALTLAGNVVNTAINGPKGNPNENPIPLIKARFEELAKGTWADRERGVGGVRYDKEKLATAIASAKGETDPAPYAAKMEGKVDPKTGATVAPDTKAAISYGAYALRNPNVKREYDKLVGTVGSDLASL